MLYEYHYLVAGLIEYYLDGDNKVPNIAAVKEEIIQTVSAKERGSLELMLAYYDVENILRTLDGTGSQFQSLANYSIEEVNQIVYLLTTVIDEEDNSKKDVGEDEQLSLKLFPFIEKTIRAFQDSSYAKKFDIPTEKGISYVLLTNYYNALEKSKSGFLKSWGTIDCTLRNITTAIEARKNNREIANVVIGEGDIVDNLIRSNAHDFGLKGETELIDSVLTISDQSNILKREKDFDLLRWKFIDEITQSDYFNMNFILGYFMKLCIINRWNILDPKIGQEMFDKIVGELNNGEQFPLKNKK